MFAWLFWWRPPCLLRRVHVNVKGEEIALRGVLWRTRGSWWVLRDVEIAIGGHAPEKSISDEVIIERRNISYIEVGP